MANAYRTGNVIVNQIVEMAAADEMARIERIKTAQNAYDGDYPQPLKVRSGQADDNAIPNLAKIIVDKGTAFLFGASVEFDIAQADEADEAGVDTPAEKFMDAVLKANKFSTFSRKLAESGAVGGHLFIKLEAPKQGGLFPRFYSVDPSTIHAVWDSDDIEDVYRFVIQYNATDKNGKPFVKRQTINREDNGRWTITDEESRNGGGWVTVGSPVDWPYPWPPIVTCQNLPAANCFYGRSDLEPDILHLIGRIQFILSNAVRINRIHAHPKPVGSGFKATDLNVAVDETLILPSATADLKLLEAHGDIAGSLALYNALYDILFMLARVPPISVAKLENIGAIAGVALKILYGPIMEMTMIKRDTYGDMLIVLMQHLLEMGGFGAEQDVSLEWGDPMPHNEVEQRANYVIDAENGWASAETISERLGYDWLKEQARIEEEKAAKQAEQVNQAVTATQQAVLAALMSQRNGVGGGDQQGQAAPTMPMNGNGTVTNG
jgi:hypothetical protein